MDNRILKKPRVSYSLLGLGLCTLLVQCSGVSQPGPAVSSAADSYFVGDHYSSFVVDEAAAARASGETRLFRGEGRNEANSTTYKWMVALAQDGSPTFGYISTPAQTTTKAVALTQDETRDRLRQCSKDNAGKPASDLFACMDGVMAQVESDCQNSLSIAECMAACWYDQGICKGS
ncbi:MAG: hypothetical protein ACR2OY_09740 [Boseongicola sp.]